MGQDQLKSDLIFTEEMALAIHEGLAQACGNTSSKDTEAEKTSTEEELKQKSLITSLNVKQCSVARMRSMSRKRKLIESLQKAIHSDLPKL